MENVSEFSDCQYIGPRFCNEQAWDENLDETNQDSRDTRLRHFGGIQSSVDSLDEERYEEPCVAKDEVLELSVMNGAKNKIKVELNNDDLWRVFQGKDTEMIITRAGRRMFPILDFRLTGLDLNHYYSCMVQIVSADNNHYRYDLANEKWAVTGSAIRPNPQHTTYMHPHGSALGRVWMREGAKFDKLKLSNHIKPYCDHVILTSLQKYKAQLIVTRLDVPHCERWIFDFPETSFIAVTCYQNPSITKLKIDYNPFAKAFRQGKRPVKQCSEENHEKVSGQRSPKRPCLQISSPPPVTRLHPPPPLGHFPENILPLRDPTPPPPQPPMNLYCQSYPPRDMMSNQESMQRCIPLINDPIIWEPPQSMTSQRTCLPPISSSFRFEHPAPPVPSCCKQEQQNCYPNWFSDHQDTFANHYSTSNANWMPNNNYGLFEEVQLRHHGYDNMFWREN